MGVRWWSVRLQQLQALWQVRGAGVTERLGRAVIFPLVSSRSGCLLETAAHLKVTEDLLCCSLYGKVCVCECLVALPDGKLALGRTRHFEALTMAVLCCVVLCRAGVVMGLLALSEPLPASRSMQLLLLASWAAIALGVSSMAGPTTSSSSSSSSGRGGVLGLVKLQVSALAKAFLLLLPRGFRRRLPHGVLLWLGRGANVPGGLGLGVYLRQLIQRARGGRAGSNTGDTALSLRFYDDDAVAEVLEGLGFGSASEDLSREGWQQQQQQQDVTPAGDRVLRSTAALGLGDDGGPGLPVFGVSAAAAAPAAVEAAAVTAGLQPPAAVAVGGVGVVGQLQVGVSASSMHAGSTSSPDFGGVLAPTGGRRV
jgi:hypothetical protein